MLRGSLAEFYVSQANSGIGAFILMTFIHITAAALAFGNIVPFGGGLIVPLPLILANIVACRLILSLRQRASPTETEEQAKISRIVRSALDRRSTQADQWAF